MKIATQAVPMLVVLMLATGVHAQEPTRLSKADVEALAVGKEIRYTRAANGSVVQWEVRKDGSIWYTPRTQRAVVVGGTWTIEDDGSLCTKWREDKYVTMTDGCYYFVRSGDKTSITGKRNPERIIGDLVE